MHGNSPQMGYLLIWAAIWAERDGPGRICMSDKVFLDTNILTEDSIPSWSSSRTKNGNILFIR